jgi:hypothetical protein
MTSRVKPWLHLCKYIFRRTARQRSWLITFPGRLDGYHRRIC